ncbi:McrBC 5-methylcytosine restriction system component [Virgisporangium aliadipatigenens]|uniref:McrBC 5-methylcytosine restriction system component n=1 Tax=Virgisporangium aliadipatigenens TaxID=741659 RepID=A0A8J3YE90_9ACTN|nr:restriction endonuclease [Virgisporangium aliadipatigenens]GIJ43396.1 McrBC 5-methylcytosine restriction system component [Virgisporangium aliadipatigenens]
MTGDPPVSIAELDQVGALRRLDDAQVAALTATGLVELRPEGGGRWRVMPAGRVGAVRIGGLDVEVRPKVGIARLLFLLGYAADPGFRPEDVAARPEPELWAALAEGLIRQAERALGPGVLQGYVVVDEALPLVRGRIRFADQFARRAVLPLPVELQFDEYATDIAENRILRTALRRMLAVPRLPAGTRARLSHLDGRLDGVSVLPHGAIRPAYRPSRLNARYLPALRLAELVLRNQSTEPGPGEVTTASFVVNMAKAFEDFVTTALREALATFPGRTDGQYEAHLDTGRAVRIRPDVVHVVGGRPAAVFDAKYKLEHLSSGYPGTDVYQMLAYCTALRLNEGWLVYAQGTTPAVPRRIRNTEIDVMHYPLDLSLPPSDLLLQVDALAHRAMRGGGPASVR